MEIPGKENTMKLYLDDVNFDTIKKVADIYPIDGITSNPSVLKKSGKTPVEQLRSVREFIGQDKMLMSQVVSTTAEDMIKEARVLKEIIADEKEEKYFVKLPANPQGIKAIRQQSFSDHLKNHFLKMSFHSNTYLKDA